MNKMLYFIFVIVVLSGCSESTALKKNYYFVKEEYKDWFCLDSVIKMVDDNGFECIFKNTDLQTSNLGGSSRIFFIYTSSSQSENIYQSFLVSNLKIEHSVSISAYKDGNILYIGLSNYSNNFSRSYISYNLDKKQISSSSSAVQVIFLNEYSINKIIYKDVINVKFEPLTNDQYEIVEFFYAPKRGLLKFVYQCGVKCERI